MINTINEARTPGELAGRLRQWADGADASDHLDDNDARQLAEAVERVCAPGNAAAMREALEWAAQFVELGVDDDLGADGQNLATAAEMARAALAAPARNCDTVRDGREALGWCRESVAVERDAAYDRGMRDAAYDRGMRDAIRWLLAPAEKGAKK